MQIRLTNLSFAKGEAYDFAIHVLTPGRRWLGNWNAFIRRLIMYRGTRLLSTEFL